MTNPKDIGHSSVNSRIAPSKGIFPGRHFRLYRQRLIHILHPFFLFFLREGNFFFL